MQNTRCYQINRAGKIKKKVHMLVYDGNFPARELLEAFIAESVIFQFYLILYTLY